MAYSPEMGGYFCAAKSYLPANTVVSEYCGYIKEVPTSYANRAML